MFRYIDVEKVMTSKDESNNGESLEERLDVVRWLQQENLVNPLPKMASAYALKDTLNESLPFTNVTFDFVGSLPIQLEQPQLHFFKVKNEELQDELNDSKQRCCTKKCFPMVNLLLFWS